MPELDIFKKNSGCSEFEDCSVVTINFYFILFLNHQLDTMNPF